MTTNPVLVRTRSVSKTFRTGTIEAEALRDVSIDLHAGELVLLMGPSGSGKTTLLYILSGLLRPTAGDVELCGTPITRLSEKDASEVRRRHVGFVFQTYNLFPALSAIDNVGEVLVMKDTPRSQAQARAAEILTRVGLEARLHHRPGELSGGERQRVAIARALAGDPTLVVGDEPTGALDRSTGQAIVKLLREQVSERRGVLLVTHDLRLRQFAHRILEIDDGRIVADYPVDEPVDTLGRYHG
ncbi:MAG TPA: ABC transporter ATP-binding protein [Burkholderiales bacterium]|nr:ABC transporter ATP-binding protein [Burkholderiales bacterium]